MSQQQSKGKKPAGRSGDKQGKVPIEQERFLFDSKYALFRKFQVGFRETNPPFDTPGVDKLSKTRGFPQSIADFFEKQAKIFMEEAEKPDPEKAEINFAGSEYFDQMTLAVLGYFADIDKPLGRHGEEKLGSLSRTHFFDISAMKMIDEAFAMCFAKIDSLMMAADVHVIIHDMFGENKIDVHNPPPFEITLSHPNEKIDELLFVDKKGRPAPFVTWEEAIRFDQTTFQCLSNQEHWGDVNKTLLAAFSNGCLGYTLSMIIDRIMGADRRDGRAVADRLFPKNISEEHAKEAREYKNFTTIFVKMDFYLNKLVVLSGRLAGILGKLRLWEPIKKTAFDHRRIIPAAVSEEGVGSKKTSDLRSKKEFPVDLIVEFLVDLANTHECITRASDCLLMYLSWLGENKGEEILKSLHYERKCRLWLSTRIEKIQNKQDQIPLYTAPYLVWAERYEGATDKEKEASQAFHQVDCQFHAEYEDACKKLRERGDTLGKPKVRKSLICNEKGTPVKLPNPHQFATPVYTTTEDYGIMRTGIKAWMSYENVMEMYTKHGIHKLPEDMDFDLLLKHNPWGKFVENAFAVAGLDFDRNQCALRTTAQALCVYLPKTLVPSKGLVVKGSEDIDKLKRARQLEMLKDRLEKPNKKTLSGGKREREEYLKKIDEELETHDVDLEELDAEVAAKAARLANAPQSLVRQIIKAAETQVVDGASGDLVSDDDSDDEDFDGGAASDADSSSHGSEMGEEEEAGGDADDDV